MDMSALLSSTPPSVAIEEPVWHRWSVMRQAVAWVREQTTDEPVKDLPVPQQPRLAA